MSRSWCRWWGRRWPPIPMAGSPAWPARFFGAACQRNQPERARAFWPLASSRSHAVATNRSWTLRSTSLGAPVQRPKFLAPPCGRLDRLELTGLIVPYQELAAGDAEIGAVELQLALLHRGLHEGKGHQVLEAEFDRGEFQLPEIGFRIVLGPGNGVGGRRDLAHP